MPAEMEVIILEAHEPCFGVLIILQVISAPKSFKFHFYHFKYILVMDGEVLGFDLL